MKTAFKYLFGILGIFLFSSCSEPDEINMGSKNLNASNLIQIETAQSYKVNELLY
jgi:outer membrane protein assembly factor BamE (lipoprotein component of BamABCDE complex)